MKTKQTSPFLKPIPGLRIKEGAPAVSRPTKEEIEAFPAEARSLMNDTWAVQSSLLRARKQDINWIKDRHVILAGATGQGLGGALASAVLNSMESAGSLTLLSRDLSRSLQYESGLYMQEIADKRGLTDRFAWINEGVALEGRPYDKTIEFLKSVNARDIVYINTVAAASSGMLPGYPPIYVRDIDDNGMFQWRLSPLPEKSIETTKFFMGRQAIRFPIMLEKAGFNVEVRGFADWRGSIDRCSRNPEIPEYGRHGPYSTSLFLPKDIIQKYTSVAYRTRSKVVLDFFFPIMKTRSLAFIPGGTLMGMVFDELRHRSGLPFVDIPELAIAMIDTMGKAEKNGVDNPFPRLDMTEASLELWFYEVMARLTNDKNSDFYYEKWICSSY